MSLWFISQIAREPLSQSLAAGLSLGSCRRILSALWASPYLLSQCNGRVLWRRDQLVFSPPFPHKISWSGAEASGVQCSGEEDLFPERCHCFSVPSSRNFKLMNFPERGSQLSPRLMFMLWRFDILLWVFLAGIMFCNIILRLIVQKTILFCLTKNQTPPWLFTQRILGASRPLRMSGLTQNRLCWRNRVAVVPPLCFSSFSPHQKCWV